MPNPTKLKKTSDKSLKLSRRQKWRRNPIPWAVLLGISLLMAILWVGPDYFAWADQRAKVSEYTSENTALEGEIDTQKKIRNQEQEKFEQLAKNTLNIESQRFPERINPSTVAKILEIYALQLNLSRKTSVDLKSLSFGASRPNQSGQYFELPLNIALSIDEDSLQRMIKFLQTGLYDQQLTVDTISPENKGETAALEFLDNNLLPLAHIGSLNLTEESGTEANFPRKIYNVQMQVNLFSQFE